ncbi:hypothetical protein CRUP_036031 [Coryphaenoides rupestris]|nr:hypothetical protein CRUP_036031 [Coryphaenoides rupestris]
MVQVLPGRPSLNEIRKARELYTGMELAAELGRIQQRLDNVECLSVGPFVIPTACCPYRHSQDYESIVKLVETLEKLPTFDPMAHPHRGDGEKLHTTQRERRERGKEREGGR